MECRENITLAVQMVTASYKSWSFNAFSFLMILLFPIASLAQVPVEIKDNIPQQFFSFQQIELLRDTNENYTFEEVKSEAFEQKFKSSTLSTPQISTFNTTYWFKIKIKHNSKTQKRFLLEFFDQTIDHITAYIPQANGIYQQKEFGDRYKFGNRELSHKNFEISLTNDHNEVRTYYFKIKSSQVADVIIVLRSVDWFIAYALDEYFFFGIFYGMILVFSFYNLIMYIAIRQIQYLYYVLYNLSVGLFEMSSDGIAYQYLWPNSPDWNQISYAFALCATSVFALLFTRSLLYVKAKAPKLNQVIIGIIALRIAFFCYSLIFNQDLFSYKFIEFIPLSVAFFTGIYIYKEGYLPARFFVVGYSFLFLGFTLKLLIMLGFAWLNFGVISYYSLSFCFVMEMVFLSFAIGDKLSILKRKKELVQRQMIRQMADNATLKDNLNLELERQVTERTKEVFHKSEIIEATNNELLKANEQLKHQAAEISRMNTLLEQDNQELQTNVEKIARDRVMSADVNFEEFSKIYPDKESCNLYLAELKWKDGYICRKCKNNHFYPGHIPYSKRCSKCSYEESVTTDTIFHNTRIPINKAFYMVFLIYSTKGKISSHKLAELLNLRQSTCWTYGSRIKLVMEERKSKLKKENKQGWSALVLD